MEWDARQKNCEAFEALLEDSLEGALSKEDAARVEAHLSGCAACREALETARASKQLLQWGEPAAEASPGFARLVMARIRESQPSSDRGMMPELAAFASRLAIAATLALGVLVAYTRLAPPVPNTNGTVMTAEDRSALFTDPAQQAASLDEFLRPAAGANHGQQ